MAATRFAILSTSGLQALIDELRRLGHRVLGPVVRDRAIVYGDVSSVADLPVGWMEEQDGGRYRLVRRDDAAGGA